MREINRTIGRKIHSVRIAKGLSRRHVAEAAGVESSRIYKYEKGLCTLPATRLALIAKALDKPVGYFYSGLDFDALP